MSFSNKKTHNFAWKLCFPSESQPTQPSNFFSSFKRYLGSTKFLQFKANRLRGSSIKLINVIVGHTNKQKSFNPFTIWGHVFQPPLPCGFF